MEDKMTGGLKTYADLYQKGLKKKANQFLQNFLLDFEKETPLEEREKVYFALCQGILESDALAWLCKRGNRQVPYWLNIRLRDYLYDACEQNKMPQLRWFYQLYSRYRIDADVSAFYDAYPILVQAYHHHECDQQTVDLIFDAHLENLYWGAHHLPDGLIISADSVRESFCCLEKILAQKSPNSRLLSDYNYLQSLYRAYRQYLAAKKAQPFNWYCQKEGIMFNAPKACYYRK